MKRKSQVELISLLFSHNDQNNKIFIRETNSARNFFELVYPKQILNNSYKKNFTKKQFLTFVEPFLEQIDSIFEKTKPDIVFINGVNLTNLMLLEIAFRREIPSCIQHAGIFKKELMISQEHFSPPIRRILASLEKEICKKATHQIFLNEYSLDVFCTMHNIPKSELLKKSSIIPIPVDIFKTKEVSLKSREEYNVGMVARWDKIKNHGSIMRLVTYIKKHEYEINLNVVTQWHKNTVSNFKDTYEKLVSIVPAMTPKMLKNYYASQDIIIIPSRFDVYPMILIEAVSCGTPAIVSNKTGWVSDYKKFGLEKLIISPNASGEKIYNVINELITNKSKYIPKFEKLQKQLIQDHNPNRIFEKYYQTFNKIK